MKRKIAAIMSADVANYSRLVADDEEDAVGRLMAEMTAFAKIIGQHEGRVVNTAGDALIAEFPSAVEALRASAEMQRDVRARNAGVAKDRQLWFRIGLTIGDVVEQDNGDLLGDAVNIAARLQGCAEPGGICVSHWMHEQVSGKLKIKFRDLGRQTLKNMAAPIQVFAADMGEPVLATATVTSGVPVRQVMPRISPRILVGGIIAGAAALAVYALAGPSLRPDTAIATPSVSRPAEPQLAPKPTPVALPAAPAIPPPSDPPAAATTVPVTVPSVPQALEPPIKSKPTPVALPAIPVAPPPAASPSPPPRNDEAATPPAPLPEPPIAAPGLKPAAAPSVPPVDSTPLAHPLAAPDVRKTFPTNPAAKEAKTPADRKRSAAQCAEILERAQLGDLTSDDQDVLRHHCR